MAFPKLTSTGITFSDSTILTSRYNVIPQNTVSVFYQAAAPTGWTKSTDHNDKTLRVVSGTGGGSGGNVSFSSAFSLTSVSGTSTINGGVGAAFLSSSQIPAHTHANGGSVGLTPGFGVASGSGWTINSPGTGGVSGGGGASHTHPFSGTGTFSGGIDLRCQYIDVIIASYN